MLVRVALADGCVELVLVDGIGRYARDHAVTHTPAADLGYSARYRPKFLGFVQLRIPVSCGDLDNSIDILGLLLHACCIGREGGFIDRWVD